MGVVWSLFEVSNWKDQMCELPPVTTGVPNPVTSTTMRTSAVAAIVKAAATKASSSRV